MIKMIAVGRHQVDLRTLEKWLDRPNMPVGSYCQSKYKFKFKNMENETKPFDSGSFKPFDLWGQPLFTEVKEERSKISFSGSIWI